MPEIENFTMQARGKVTDPNEKKDWEFTLLGQNLTQHQAEQIENRLQLLAAISKSLDYVGYHDPDAAAKDAEIAAAKNKTENLAPYASAAAMGIRFTVMSWFVYLSDQDKAAFASDMKKITDELYEIFTVGGIADLLAQFLPTNTDSEIKLTLQFKNDPDQRAIQDSKYWARKVSNNGQTAKD